MGFRAAFWVTNILFATAPAQAGWLPAYFSDSRLETIVRTAYSAASAYAEANGNYFARDGVTAPLREAVTAAFAAAPEVAIAAAVPEDLAFKASCIEGTGAELRIATNVYGDGLSLVVVTSRRTFAYSYEPHEAVSIAVTPAANCSKS